MKYRTGRCDHCGGITPENDLRMNFGLCNNCDENEDIFDYNTVERD